MPFTRSFAPRLRAAGAKKRFPFFTLGKTKSFSEAP
jgi:hypothetical protein